MRKKIGFTYDIIEDLKVRKGLTDDAYAEFDVEETIENVERTFESGGYKVVRIGNVESLLSKIGNLDVDIVFNICEGFGNRNRESEVPVLLDMYKIPFVGSDGLTLGMTLDKAIAKKVFTSDGIPTPKYFIASNGNGWVHKNSMKFPLIVKPRHEGSSKGIEDDSIVTDRSALKKQIDKIHRHYQQPAIVEEFVPGKEFTVLVIGNEAPRALVPVQMQILGKLDLGDLIYTSARVVNTDIDCVCPASISKRLEKKMCELAVKAYQALDCRDFARIDFRTDEKDNLYVLEVNPLPSVSTEDVFPLVAKEEGMTYQELMLKIIDIALKRYGLDK